MITMIALVKKKPGMSDEAFRAHYESVHAQTVHYIEHLVVDYQRNYPIKGFGYDLEKGIEVSRSVSAPPPKFDCITKLTFRDHAALEAAQSVLADPRIKAEVEADEENFLDRGATEFYVCDQSVSQLKNVESA